MTTKERFEEKFGYMAQPDFVDLTQQYADFKVFFRQELLALAETIEVAQVELTPIKESMAAGMSLIEAEGVSINATGYNNGNADAVALIRAKANELSDPNQQQ